MRAREIQRAIEICDMIAKHAGKIAELRIELVVIERALKEEPSDDMPTSPGTPTSKSQQFKAANVTQHLPPMSKGRY